MAFDIFWMNVAAGFAFVNIAFVALLIGLYFRSWQKVRSSLSLALILFAVFFLVQNGVIVVFWYVLYGLGPPFQSVVVSAAPYLAAINALETLALANLVRITWS